MRHPAIGPGSVVAIMAKCKGDKIGKHMLVVFAVDSCTNSKGPVYAIAAADSASKCHFVDGRVMLLNAEGRDHIVWKSDPFTSQRRIEESASVLREGSEPRGGCSP